MTEEHAYLARHLRVLSLQIMEAGAQICAELDPVLLPTWPSLLVQLDDVGRLTVMDAARGMNVSHVHAQNVLKSMKKSGVVSTASDPNDGRRTFYRLTRKGRALLPLVERLGTAITGVIEDIEEETGDDLFAAIKSFRHALAERDWKTRIMEKLVTVGRRAS